MPVTTKDQLVLHCCIVVYGPMYVLAPSQPQNGSVDSQDSFRFELTLFDVLSACTQYRIKTAAGQENTAAQRFNLSEQLRPWPLVGLLEAPDPGRLLCAGDREPNAQIGG
jgi:hypothetical protein